MKEGKNNLTAEELEAGTQPRRGFRGTRGKAKALGREWNDGKSLRAGCGVEVIEHMVTGGKPGMLAWLNGIVGGPVEEVEGATPGKGGKGAAGKGAKAPKTASKGPSKGAPAAKKAVAKKRAKK